MRSRLPCISGCLKLGGHQRGAGEMKQEVVQNQNLLVIQGQGQRRQLYVKLLAGKEKQNYGLMQMNREIYLISHKLLLKNLHTLFPMILI